MVNSVRQNEVCAFPWPTMPSFPTAVIQPPPLYSLALLRAACVLKNIPRAWLWKGLSSLSLHTAATAHTHLVADSCPQKPPHPLLISTTSSQSYASRVGSVLHLAWCVYSTWPCVWVCVSVVYLNVYGYSCVCVCVSVCGAGSGSARPLISWRKESFPDFPGAPG